MGNLSCLSTLWSSSISTPTILTSGQIARPTSQQVEAVQNPDLVGGVPSSMHVIEQSKDPKITNDSLLGVPGPVSPSLPPVMNQCDHILRPFGSSVTKWSNWRVCWPNATLLL